MAAQASCQPREQGDRLDGRTGGEHGLLDEPTVVDRQGVAERRHPDRPDRRHPITGRTTRHGAEVHPRRPTEIAGRRTLEHDAHRRLPRRRRPRGTSGERRRPPRGVDDDTGPKSRAVAELHDVATTVSGAERRSPSPSGVRSRRAGGPQGLVVEDAVRPVEVPRAGRVHGRSRRASTRTASPCRRGEGFDSVEVVDPGPVRVRPRVRRARPAARRRRGGSRRQRARSPPARRR